MNAASAALDLAIALTLTAPPPDLDKEVTVAASPSDVWRAFTTSEGAATFFAPQANIRLEPGGPYEILFNPAAKPGERGAEGMRVLAFIPERLLAFEWNAPPKFPEIRNGKRNTFVVVELAAAGPGRTRVALHHGGFAEGGRWPEVRAYFDPAWDWVLANLVKRFEQGPIDWKAMGK
jgi:uncharacterized protein YndB with AHSA1/START domain